MAHHEGSLSHCIAQDNKRQTSRLGCRTRRSELIAAGQRQWRFRSDLEQRRGRGEPIDRLCDQLRIKLHGIDRRLEALKANGSDMSDKSRHQLESQMNSVQQRIFDRRRAVETANARVTAWVERKRPAFDRQGCRVEEASQLSGPQRAGG